MLLHQFQFTLSSKFKAIKKTIKISLLVLSMLIALAWGALYALRFKTVQTRACQYVVSILSEQLHAKVSVQSVDFRLFSSLIIKGFLVHDLTKDTLLYADELAVSFKWMSLRKRTVALRNVRLLGGKFNLKSSDGNTSNLDFLIRYFAGGKSSKGGGSKFTFTLDRLLLEKFTFTYRLKGAEPMKGRINYDDVYVRDFNMEVEKPRMEHGVFKGHILHLSLKEKSGFVLNDLTTECVIGQNRMEFSKLYLKIAQTVVRGYYGMFYRSFSDFGDYNNKVIMVGELHHTQVNLQDIAFFAPPVMPLYNLSVGLNGRIVGPVNRLKANNLLIKLGTATYAKGTFLIKHTDNPKKIFMDFKFRNLGTNQRDLATILPVFFPISSQQIPTRLSNLGYVNFKGNFTGTLSQMNAQGFIKTNLGLLDMRANLLTANFDIQKMQYTALLATPRFVIGNLLAESGLMIPTDEVILRAQIAGVGFNPQNLSEQLNVEIQKIQIKGVTLHDVTADGLYTQKIFKGNIRLADDNFQASFNGLLDFSNHAKFVFNAHVDKLNAHLLGLPQDSVFVSGDVIADFSGHNFYDFKGQCAIKQASIFDVQKQYFINAIDFSAYGQGAHRVFQLRSDLFDAEINGVCYLPDLPIAFAKVVNRYLPSYTYTKRSFGEQNFDFDFNIKNIAPFTAFFLPDLHVHKGGKFRGSFHSMQDSVVLNGAIDDFSYKNIGFKKLIIDQSSAQDRLEAFASLDEIDLPTGIPVHNIIVANLLRNDTLNFNLKVSDQKDWNEMDINGLLTFQEDKCAPFLFTILPSKLLLENKVWHINDLAKIQLGYQCLKIQNLQIARENQSLNISADTHEARIDASFILSKINFDSFGYTLKHIYGLDLKGELNGKIDVFNVARNPVATCDIRIDKMAVNNVSAGDITLKSSFDAEHHLLSYLAHLEDNKKQLLSFSGNLDTDRKTIDGEINITDFSVPVFEPFIKSYVANLQGNLGGLLKLTGNISKPIISGMLELRGLKGTINYLNTTYQVTDKLLINEGIISFNNVVFVDTRKHNAIANGTIDVRDILRPKFNVNMLADDLVMMNTSSKDNADFYGKMIGSGTANFMGEIRDMSMNFTIQTEPGTICNLSFSGNSKVSDNEFIRFVSKDTLRANNRSNIPNGLTINVALNIDESAVANIQTNVGKLTTQGKGNINLKLSSLGDFSMSGDYLITKGRYELSSQNALISNLGKKLELREGSTIKWSGNPTDALLDVKAVYPVVTQIAPLYQAAGRVLSDSDPKSYQQYPVDVILSLKGLLTTPDIAFDINFPTDATVKDDLSTYLNDNNKFTQAVSLMIKRSFSKGNADIVDSKAGLQIGAEYIFNQANHLMAELLGVQFINFNSRSLNDIQTSLKLFNNRLAFNGGVINNGQNLSKKSTDAESTALSTLNNTVATNLSIDVEASYLIKKDGSLTVRAYNRPSTFNIYNLNGGQSINGIGLVFYKDFDAVLDIFRSSKREKNFIKSANK